MTLIEIFAISTAAGILAYAIARVTIGLRHWWENETERWSDWAREWRQFLERLQPLVYAFVAAVVIGGASAVMWYDQR